MDALSSLSPWSLSGLRMVLLAEDLVLDLLDLGDLLLADALSLGDALWMTQWRSLWRSYSSQTELHQGCDALVPAREEAGLEDAGVFLEWIVALGSFV